MRGEGRPVLALNAGNLLFKREFFKPSAVDAAQQTAELILEANQHINYDAVSVGAYDLSLGVDYLLYKQTQGSIPFLSANLYGRHPQERIFPATMIKQVGSYKVGIIGLLDDGLKVDKLPDGRKLVVTDPIKEAQELAPRLKEQGADLVVALTDMKGGGPLKLAHACKSIDIIISSDKSNQISIPIVEGSTYLTHLDRGGKCVGRFDVLSAAAATKDDPTQARGQKVGKFFMRHNFVQLRLVIPDHPVVGPMVVERKKSIAIAQKKEIAEGKEADSVDCGTKYVGEAACQKCHADRHKKWLTTKHSLAFATLEAKSSQYDPACVMCHCLAFECEKGKLSLTNIEAFKNVQCESCHGPGELHVKSKGEQSMKPLPTLKTCLKCHTPARSSSRLFETRLPTICGARKKT